MMKFRDKIFISKEIASEHEKVDKLLNTNQTQMNLNINKHLEILIIGIAIEKNSSKTLGLISVVDDKLNIERRNAENFIYK